MITNKIKEFLKYLFVFEKTKFYSGGALRNPIPITQQFWDEMKERKEYYTTGDGTKERGVDTNYGSVDADMGNRPVVPDWIINMRRSWLLMSAVIGWPIIIAYLIIHH